MQKVGQRLVSFDGNLNFVLFRPDNDADQGHEDVERRVQLQSNRYMTKTPLFFLLPKGNLNYRVDDVGDIFASPKHPLEVLFLGFVAFIVDHKH